MGVEEAAPAVQTQDGAGPAGRGCKGPPVRWEGVRRALTGKACLLTDGRQRGGGRLHAGAVVERVPVGAGADGAAGAQQAQPLTFLPVAGIIH